jgi:4-amino-4-deoxy-L-arabinose transferase-like glycosyltransferase
VTALTLGRPRAGARATAVPAARWPRWALAGLLAATALLYLIGLSRNGWANDFYSAAVQAGTRSWKAFFFGSFDSSNFITVDKTPASLWVMELSARVFGLSYWSVLVPQALEGVGAVALLYAAVRRWFGPGAGLLAGAALALTPVATLMFRFNNPDALLVLLMTAAAYALVRAVESGRTRWLVLAGALLGFGFLTKMLQAFLVLPGFGLVYLVAGPPRLGRRIWQLAAGLAAMVVAAGWWVAAVMLTPAADRPYAGGSTNDSILQLALGYNGLGRLDGHETGSVGFSNGHGGSPSFSGTAGFGRLFASDMGGQISWLLPAALLGLGVLGVLAVLAWRGRRVRRPVGRPVGRTDRNLAAGLLWGGWLVVTGVVFSFMAGIIHPYYSVALAPAIAALTAIGAVLLWRRRTEWPSCLMLALGVVVTAGWSFELLDRSPGWYPWLRFAVLAVGVAAAAGLLAGRTGRAGARVAAVAGAGAIAAALAGPAAYSLDAAATAHAGALPTAGPAVTTGFGGPGGGPGGTGGSRGTGGPGGAGFGGGTAPRSGTAPGRATAPGGTKGGLPGGAGQAGTGRAGGFPGRGGAGARAGGPGGLGGSTQVSAALAKLIERDASAYTWAAATVGSESAAPLQLATDQPVMSIGGFNGTDPAPTLSEFKHLVAEHKIHYFVGQNSDSFGGGSGPAAAITSWVKAHFRSQTVGGDTVYNLTEPR